MNKKLIFLGTPTFAVPSLERLIVAGFVPALVITQPDKPVGRDQVVQSSPIKIVAEKNSIPVAQPKNKQELAEIITQAQPDVCVLVAYGMIIPAAVLSLPKFGFINIHPSLLPRHRGSSPIQAAVLAGDSETGVTIMQLDERVDTGPVLIQEKIIVSLDDTAHVLHDALATLGADLLVRVLPEYLNGTVQLQSQDDSQATMTGMVRRESGRIDWSKSAIMIERQFRAYSPWPGIFTHIDSQRLKIAKLSVFEGSLEVSRQPGQVALGPQQELLVVCAQGAVELLEVQLEGKKVVSAQEFIRGNADFVGTTLA